MRDAGRTILLVTHDMSMVSRFCHRALLLEHGEMVTLGEPKDVGREYLELNFGRAAAQERASGVHQRAGDHAAQIVDAWIEDEQGARVETPVQGRNYTVKTHVRFEREVEDPAFTLIFQNDQHQDVFVGTTSLQEERSGRFAAGDSVVFWVRFDVVFAPGRYSVSAIVAHRGSGHDLIDRVDGVLSFVLAATYATGGLIDVPYQTFLERRAPERIA